MWGKLKVQSLNCFPGVLVSCCCCCYVASVVSDSVRPHRQQPTSLLCLQNSPGKSTGVCCRFLLQVLVRAWFKSFGGSLKLALL